MWVEPTGKHGCDMGKNLTRTVMFSVGIAVTACYNAGDIWATPAVGFATTTLLRGKLGEINVLSKFPARDSSEHERQIEAWLSLQKTKGPADLYVQSNVWQPGGSTGWHIHAGHSLIIVNEGIVTEYDGHDPDCKPHAYSKGMTFVDPGGDHIHTIRNEGEVVAQTTAIQLIPVGAARRIDVEDPGNCQF
ncbi:MAG: cupin domain-containing protein [Edaphobacter sp.]